MLKAAREQDKALWQMAKTQGWLTAALGRRDEFPTLEELLGDDEGEAPSRSGSGQVVEDHNWRLWQMVIDRQFGGDTVQ